MEGSRSRRVEKRGYEQSVEDQDDLPGSKKPKLPALARCGGTGKQFHLVYKHHAEVGIGSSEGNISGYDILSDLVHCSMIHELSTDGGNPCVFNLPLAHPVAVAVSPSTMSLIITSSSDFLPNPLQILYFFLKRQTHHQHAFRKQTKFTSTISHQCLDDPRDPAVPFKPNYLHHGKDCAGPWNFPFPSKTSERKFPSKIVFPKICPSHTKENMSCYKFFNSVPLRPGSSGKVERFQVSEEVERALTRLGHAKLVGRFVSTFMGRS
ncbi:hypothetical protein CK203_115568 [Vitis vinifera]|uniref:Uncharacterized protein n=1 Tax=Vitis vinifera TaxID=29760 RepID=A0A438E7J4_VITVI|nr:hypothetical protein CK203_115568 [Vitis vinifera]